MSYYSENRERALSYMKNRRKMIKQHVFEQMGGKCVLCGYKENFNALVIDHVNGDGFLEPNRFKRKWGIRNATSTKNHTGYNGVLVSYLRGDGKYQLLCANCNQIKKIESCEYGERTFKMRENKKEKSLFVEQGEKTIGFY